MWRKVGVVPLALLTMAAVGAPGAGATPEGESTSPAPPQPQTYAQPIAWGSCEPMLGDAIRLPTAQCGTVSVPVDWADAANPQAPQAQLAVIRIPATGERIGTLMVNPGGPGASAVDMAAGMGVGLAGTVIARHFDLVGFDPRGVGHSTPRVRCRTDAEFDAFRADPMVDYSQAGVAHIEQVFQALAQGCVANTGSDFLANVGTASTVRDMDAVRAALGDEQLNYLGFSYGTELGARYAAQFPERVRAMVLDGAVDPATDPMSDSLGQMAGFQTAFNDYAMDCARSTDCPLGQDPTQFVARFHQLVDPLVQRPAWTPDGRGLGYADAITGTVNALYSKQLWKYLTSGLLGLRDGAVDGTNGIDAADLQMLADDYWHRDATGHYETEQDAFTAIRCVDAPYPTDPAVWAEADQRAREAAPFMAYGSYTGFAPRDVCAMWPFPSTSTPHAVTSPGPGKVVVVSTTHDPATPYQDGVNLARELDASLITFDGTQHTVVFNGDACVDPAVVNFLLDQTLPPPQLRC